jgi:hypothetical protein
MKIKKSDREPPIEPKLPVIDKTKPPGDAKYLKIVTSAINVCADYQPKFGQGKDVSLREFRALYQSDAFYAWFGLDSPLMYAAHKAAGGMTSIYRQIGIGCQYLLNQIIQDSLGLSEANANWTYMVKASTGEDGKERRLSLDARIPVDGIGDGKKRERVKAWMEEAGKKIGLPPDQIKALQGGVLEIRQGYKSKDSKRQNADVSNATNAYLYHYLPVVLMLSNQIDEDIAERYVRARWLILRGTVSGSKLTSAYKFYSEVVGYDLQGFFTRNCGILKAAVEDVLKKLLEPSN